MAPGKAKMETVQIGLTCLILLVFGWMAAPADDVMTWVGAGAAAPGCLGSVVAGRRWRKGRREGPPEGVERCSLTKSLHFPMYGFGTLPCSCMGRHL